MNIPRYRISSSILIDRMMTTRRRTVHKLALSLDLHLLLLPILFMLKKSKNIDNASYPRLLMKPNISSQSHKLYSGTGYKDMLGSCKTAYVNISVSKQAESQFRLRWFSYFISSVKYARPVHLSDFPFFLPKNEFGKSRLFRLLQSPTPTTIQVSPLRRIKAALDGYFKCWYCWDFVGLTQGLYQDTFFVSIISGLPMRWTSSREGRLWNDNILVWTLMDSSNSYQKQRSTPDQSKSITKLIFQSWVEFSVNIPGKIKRRRWLITYHHVVTVWFKRKEYKAESKSEEIMLGKFLLSQLIRKAGMEKFVQINSREIPLPDL